MNRILLCTISVGVIGIFALTAYFVWHETTEEECYTGFGSGRKLDCIDGTRKR